MAIYPLIRRTFSILIVFGAVIGLFSNVITVNAQEAGLWTTPISLSRGILDSDGRPASSQDPVLVTDSAGIVHAFWASEVDRRLGAVGNALMYAQYDGQSWSTPVDIFYSPANIYWLPQAVIDKDDRIHLVWASWNGGGYIMYSQASSSDAGQVRAWSKPIQVSNETATNPAIAISTDGSVHIVYFADGNDKHISYVWSKDGKSWPPPVIIGYSQKYMNPRLAIDGRNRLHVVYGEMGAGTAVYYSQSSNNGQSWSSPLTIDSKDKRYYGAYGPAWINVITIGKDDVHVIWDGSPSGQRWHTWSDDGGLTWKTPEQLSPTVRGLTGANALGIDSTGRIYLFTMGIAGTAPYYASWWKGHWSSMDPLTGMGWDGEGPALTIRKNQIIVAWWERNTDPSLPALEVFTSMATLDLSNKSQNIQVEQVTPKMQAEIPTATMLPTFMTENLNLTSTPAVPVNPQSSSTYSSTVLLVIAFLPAILFTGIILLVRLKRTA